MTQHLPSADSPRRAHKLNNRPAAGKEAAMCVRLGAGGAVGPRHEQMPHPQMRGPKTPRHGLQNSFKKLAVFPRSSGGRNFPWEEKQFYIFSFK